MVLLIIITRNFCLFVFLFEVAYPTQCASASSYWFGWFGEPVPLWWQLRVYHDLLNGVLLRNGGNGEGALVLSFNNRWCRQHILIFCSFSLFLIIILLSSFIMTVSVLNTYILEQKIEYLKGLKKAINYNENMIKQKKDERTYYSHLFLQWYLFGGKCCSVMDKNCPDWTSTTNKIS